MAVAFYFSLPQKLFDTGYATVITDSSGNLLGAYIANDGQWRFPPADSVPYRFRTSLVMFEDEYFYYHPGVNPISLGRALWQNLRHRCTVSGGSTITMQVIRLARPARRTIIHKIKEMYLAIRLECSLSKDSILALYAAEAPFGGNTVGIEAAAWRYFNRPARELTWGESAALAVLPNAPALVHPGKNRSQLLYKRNRLLHKLHDSEIIDSTTLKISLAEALPGEPQLIPRKAPHLLDRQIVNRRGTILNTSLDGNLQQLAAQVVNRHANQLQQNQIYNAAAVIVSVQSGKALAYVGNVDGDDDAKGYRVDVVQSPRSSGSVLKPLLYAKALQEGIVLPRTLLPDIPTYYRNFSPQNYQRRFDGAVAANEALSRSLNVPFVRLLNNYGGDIFTANLQQMGFSTVDKPYSHYGLSLILGGCEVTLWDLAGCYASMARMLNRYTTEQAVYNGADFRPLTFLNNDTFVLTKNTFHPPVMSASAAYFAFKAMTNVQRPPEETGWENFSSSRRIAWKTGTSYGFRDAWSIGVTPEYVVAVWVGNASGEGRPGIVGGATAAPIMFELLNLLPPTSVFAVPYDDMAEVRVCAASGYRASSTCSDTDTVLIPLTVKKTGACPYHRLVYLTADGRFQTRMECEPLGNVRIESRFVLPPVVEWYYKPHHPEYRSLPPVREGCEALENSAPLDFIYPPPQTSVYVPTGLDGQLSRIVMKAVHRNPDANLYWHFNSDYLGSTKYQHQFEVLPLAGINTVTIVDDEGNRIVRRFVCAGE